MPNVKMTLNNSLLKVNLGTVTSTGQQNKVNLVIRLLHTRAIQLLNKIVGE